MSGPPPVPDVREHKSISPELQRPPGAARYFYIDDNRAGACPPVSGG